MTDIRVRLIFINLIVEVIVMENIRGCCCSVSRQNIKRTTSHVDESLQRISSPEFISNLIFLKGGEFLMGTNDQEGFQEDGEGPVRLAKVKPFYLSAYAVTNREFQSFVEATNYKTDAEKFGWSFVFHLFVSEKTKRLVTQTAQQAPWWWVVEGANWKYPEGPDSNIDNRLDHPVVHVSWNDANAFCKWSNTRLPTEVEWEYAARGGLIQKKYPWGDELTPDGKHRCNIWQGQFPVVNDASDGFIGTANVDAYEPNGFGLYNMVGNVWEWCSNDFSLDLQYTNKIEQAKAMRGGSYLCHDSYCNRYRVAARTSNTADSSTGNIGFRYAKDI